MYPVVVIFIHSISEGVNIGPQKNIYECVDKKAILVVVEIFLALAALLRLRVYVCFICIYMYIDDELITLSHILQYT
jgi:hypothetical protein